MVTFNMIADVVLGVLILVVFIVWINALVNYEPNPHDYDDFEEEPFPIEDLLNNEDEMEEDDDEYNDEER